MKRAKIIPLIIVLHLFLDNLQATSDYDYVYIYFIKCEVIEFLDNNIDYEFIRLPASIKYNTLVQIENHIRKEIEKPEYKCKTIRKYSLEDEELVLFSIKKKIFNRIYNEYSVVVVKKGEKFDPVVEKAYNSLNYDTKKFKGYDILNIQSSKLDLNKNYGEIVLKQFYDKNKDKLNESEKTALKKIVKKHDK